MKKLLLLASIATTLLASCSNVRTIKTGDGAKMTVTDNKLDNYTQGDSVIVITDLNGDNSISSDGYKSLHADTTINFTQYRVGIILNN